jgi:hypothetical protein
VVSFFPRTQIPDRSSTAHLATSISGDPSPPNHCHPTATVEATPSVPTPATVVHFTGRIEERHFLSLRHEDGLRSPSPVSPVGRDSSHLLPLIMPKLALVVVSDEPPCIDGSNGGFSLSLSSRFCPVSDLPLR